VQSLVAPEVCQAHRLVLQPEGDQTPRLTPRDFGLVAIGMTVVTFGYFLADFGIGAMLIRRPEAPDVDVVESLLGFQLLAGSVVALVTVAVSTSVGGDALVTAVIVMSLPLLAARAPTGILLERNLQYRPLVMGEVGETAVYYAFAIATALLGWGVWSLAFAALVRSASGTAIVIALAKSRIIRPRLSWRQTRRLFSFGLQYQAVGLTNLVRDQGLNVGVAGLGGVTTLGIWTFANRILQVPFLVFTALWRVSYPAMSRLIALGESPAPLIQRALTLGSVATGLMLVPLAGSAPALVPVLLGARWQSVAGILPWPCLGLMVSGPISVAVAGYLYATGNAAAPLRAAVLHTTVWLGLALPLLPVIGVQAIGYGWLGGCVVDALVLGRAAARRVPIRISRALAIPTLTATAAAAVGWRLASSGTANPARLVLAALIAETIYVLGLLLFNRRAFLDTLGTTGSAFRTTVARA
ncbi:MAG: oligosaccharide flippase family protein, partial [Polyangiaceae bacterium]